VFSLECETALLEANWDPKKSSKEKERQLQKIFKAYQGPKEKPFFAIIAAVGICHKCQ
jgi:hypothetical protein